MKQRSDEGGWGGRLATYVELLGQLLPDVGGNLVGGEEKVEFVVLRERHYWW